MDFNIDNETFANAYKCLDDANELINEGLGSFSELDKSALILIEQKFNLENDSKLSNVTDICQDLKYKMKKTINFLSQMSIEAETYFESILGDLEGELIGFGDLYDGSVSKEEIEDFIESIKNGSILNEIIDDDGYTGYKIGDDAIYYDSETGDFYIEVAPDYSDYEIGNGGRQMIWLAPEIKKISPDYILDNIDSISKEDRRGILPAPGPGQDGGFISVPLEKNPYILPNDYPDLTKSKSIDQYFLNADSEFTTVHSKNDSN